MLALCSFTHVRVMSLAPSACVFVWCFSSCCSTRTSLNTQHIFGRWQCLVRVIIRGFSCANVSARRKHKLMHGSTVIKWRETSPFFFSLPASCHSSSAREQARCDLCKCIHKCYGCEGAHFGSYICVYVYICLQFRFLCVRGRSHFHSLKIFSIRSTE